MAVPPKNLALHIIKDVFTVGLPQTFLLLVVLVSAIAIVLKTHDTRLLVVQQEQLLIERDQLDIEWRNQQLEENTLSEHSRIEYLAEQSLQMARPSRDQEVVVK